MKSYCHIEEFGVNRYEFLPVMAYCFEKTAIWGPDFCAMKQSHDRGKSFFSPSNFLELVDKGHIQVMGREDWFCRKERSSGKFAVSSWLEGFDNVLRDWGWEDRKEALNFRRVIMEPPATGEEEAVKMLNSKLKKDKTYIDFVKKQISQSNLPTRPLKNANKAESDEEKLLSVLKSAHNNRIAFEHSKAEIPIVLENSDVYLENIFQKQQSRLKVKSTSNNDFDRVSEILSILQRFNIRKDPDEFIKNLESNERKTISKEFSAIIELDVPVTALFSRAVRSDIDRYRNSQKNNILSTGVSLASLILALVLFQTPAFFTYQDIFVSAGLILSMYPALKGISEQRGLMPARGENIEYRLPYVFSAGSANPNLINMLALYDQLQENKG